MKNFYLQKGVENWSLPIIPLDELSPVLNPFLKDKVRLMAVSSLTNPYVTFKMGPVAMMLEEASNNGLLDKVDTLVESTSGATGLCLVHFARHYGKEALLVMKDSVPRGKRFPIRDAGGKIIKPNDGMSAIETARHLGGGGWRPNGEWKVSSDGMLNLDQYANPMMVAFYRDVAAPKISANMLGGFRLLVCPIGTGATITGLSHGLKNAREGLYVIGAMCAEGENIPGMRSLSQMTEIRHPWQRAIDDTVEVMAREAWLAVLQIQYQSGIMPGPSSGASYIAALKTVEWYRRAGMLDSLRSRDGFVNALIVFHDGLRPYADELLPVPEGWLDSKTAPMPWSIPEWNV